MRCTLLTVHRSDACWEEAKCIVEPHNSAEVAKALRIVAFTKSRFATRSGGHNPNKGWASIDQTGILIDMVNFNLIQLNTEKSVLSVGPGNRFGAVYKALNGTGRTIVGGRVTDVGISGYMLGGKFPRLHKIQKSIILTFFRGDACFFKSLRYRGHQCKKLRGMGFVLYHLYPLC